ncbi:MAG: hypothetical protein IKE01_06185 [Clostridia bacterium]|nr:hypothetical protein [Clostridia bacterium]
MARNNKARSKAPRKGIFSSFFEKIRRAKYQKKAQKAAQKAARKARKAKIRQIKQKANLRPKRF